MPQLSDVKETALYVEELPRARQFYLEVMGLSLLAEDPRFCAFDVAGKHILLLFVRGASLTETQLPGGTIPPHDGHGPAHVGFSVTHEELPTWEKHFVVCGIPISGEVRWPNGGRSIYFRDPDGHLLELLTPGVWATY